ncbi:two-component system response regulator PrrA [Gordonia jinhuaensis]|uniref:DNA-binding response regulator n=1 Tax=Gordonia jinhuaensis TaxID=1517702 RepID=A0A916WXN7_9ACTN|nr:response regulator transcription factor [Gordonia jinhuaensis]GGB38000.1 DNA-binding response regulator [Gordonia jinhuaensis]
MSSSDETAPQVLIVDDDPDILTSLQMGLGLSGFVVSTAETGMGALASVEAQQVDAIVVDMNLPDIDGVAVVAALRESGSQIPICVLSARTSVDDRIIGLEAGADDYLVKPFHLGELVARLRALLRRPRAAPVPTDAASDAPTRLVQVGDVTIDLPGRRVECGRRAVDLTPREFDLLAALAAEAGTARSRTELLADVWGYDFPVQTKVVDVFVGYLRRKLERDGSPRVVHTVRGYGFVLRSDTADLRVQDPSGTAAAADPTGRTPR